MNSLQQIYESEINFVISTFWDDGFHWKLGDDMNGFIDKGCALTIDEATEQLTQSAIKHFPESKLAKDAKSKNSIIICKTCGGELAFNGTYYFHTSAAWHPPIPDKELPEKNRL